MVSHGVCQTPHPDWAKYHAIHTRQFYLNAINSDSGAQLYVDVKYTCLFSDESEKIPIERIQDMHRMLEECYNLNNSDELAQLPQNTRYPYRNLATNAKISFLPLDANKVTVQYHKVTGSLDSSNPVNHASSAVTPENGVLNVYIGNSGNGSILGQALLGSNTMYVLFKAVGGRTFGGTLALYDQGKTAVHEAGHVFSLTHPFTDSQCDGHGPFSDIPEQINPNYNARIFFNNGEWDMKDDNRYSDRHNGTRISCLSSGNLADQNEFASQFMDYLGDSESRAFSAVQVIQMRAHLLGSSNSTITLKAADDVSYSELNPTRTHESTIDLSETSDTLDIVVIIVGAVLGAIVVAVVIGLMVKRNVKKMSHYSWIR